MGKRLLKPRSKSAGAKTQAKTTSTLSQEGTQMLISDDNNNRNINQDFDEHMSNTTIPATTSGLAQSQTEQPTPHVTDNGRTPTEIEHQSNKRQTQMLVMRDQSAWPPTPPETTSPTQQVSQAHEPRGMTQQQPNSPYKGSEQTQDMTQDTETQTNVSQADAAVQTYTLLHKQS